LSYIEYRRLRVMIPLNPSRDQPTNANMYRLLH